MILQQLYRDANAIMQQTGLGTLPPSMYVPKPLRWIIDLSMDERIPPFFSPLIGDGKKGERGIDHLLPERKRSGKVIRPFVLADAPSYVLGITYPDPKKDLEHERSRTALKHKAFRRLVRECAEKTGLPGVARAAGFVERWDPENPMPRLPPDMSAGDTIAFRVDGALLTDDTAVQEFWAAWYGKDTDGNAKGTGNTSSTMQCLVTGIYAQAELNMPVIIKGLTGGNPTGTHIVSGEIKAMASYGWKRSQNSPICREAGERFGKALNALLASPNHRQSSGNLVYVFWAAGGIVPLFAFLPPPDPATLKAFITAVRRGDTTWANQLPADEKFHIFGLSANAARVVVRSALDTTIGEVGKRQADWFERLEIQGPDGGRPLGIKSLSVAGYREFKDIPPGVEDALTQAALSGRALPPSLLQSLVMRCRLDTDHRVTYPRAALIKFILTQDLPLEEAQQMTQEVTDGRLPFDKPDEKAAYHCGRLFAELEEIQRAAIHGINATISDRYFGSASSAPASVFGILLSGARDHLGKLRRSESRAYGASERRLEEILSEIGDFPKTLTLREQALFSLGYYHHRAAKRKDIAERTAAKKQAGQGTLEILEGDVQE